MDLSLPDGQDTPPTRGKRAWQRPPAQGPQWRDPDTLQPLQSWEHFPCPEAFASLPSKTHTSITPDPTTGLPKSWKLGARLGCCVYTGAHESLGSSGVLRPWEKPAPGVWLPFHSGLPPGLERHRWIRHTCSAQGAHTIW